MKIGVLVHDLKGGGAEAVTQLWITQLQALGHDVVVFVYGPNAVVDPIDPTITMVFPGRSKLARWTTLPWWVRRWTRRLRLDVVISVLDFSNIVALLAAVGSNRPVVISEHSAPTLLWRHKGLGGLARRSGARLLYRRATIAVAVSHAVATDLRVGLSVSAHRIVVLPNPVHGAMDTAADVNSAMPSSGAGHRLLVVGRCAPEKQMDRALEVVKELHRRGQNWSCCVIGDGPTRIKLEALAQKDELPVQFKGWVQPWQHLARQGDVMLVTSDLEGFGNVLVEAAAFGIPSVAPSSALGVGDAIIPELTGVLAASNDTQDLTDAVLRAAELRISARGIQPWLERFSPDVAGKRLEVVIQRAVLGAVLPGRVVTHVGPAPASQGGIASVLRTYRDLGVPGWRMRFFRSYAPGQPLWSAFQAGVTLLRLMTSSRTSLGVIHVHLSQGGSFVREGGLAFAASLRGLPVVVTLHGSGFEELLERHRRLVLIVLCRADRIIVLVREQRELLPALIKRRTLLVPNTVASDRGLPTPVPLQPRALFAGEVSTRKGVDILLNAWPLVRSSVPGAELLVAGPEGDVKPSRQPGVRWLGALDNESIRDLLRTSRVAVLPSRREAMPMFILEAMAIGRAIVSTPIAAIPETVGSGGLIVPVGDIYALAHALSQVLAPGGTANQIGTAARERFQNEYCPDLALGKLKQVYEDVAPLQRHALTEWGSDSEVER